MQKPSSLEVSGGAEEARSFLQDESGKWNKFGGRLAWDKSVICSNNPEFGGTGNGKTGEDYHAAPNIDHAQERVRQDIVKWLRWLKNSIGFDGWRFDFVKGYGGCAESRRRSFLSVRAA